MHYQQDGVFSGDIGDFLPRAISEVLNSPILIIRSDRLLRHQMVYPTKILNDISLAIAYTPGMCGHYDSTTDFTPPSTHQNLDVHAIGGSTDEQPRKEKPCACGRGTKTDSCLVLRCACFKNGWDCSAEPVCRCERCANPSGKRVLVPKDIQYCRCGANASSSDTTDRCISTRCNCFLAGKSCEECGCKCCNNPYGRRVQGPAPKRRKTARQQSQVIPTLARIPGKKCFDELDMQIRESWDISDLLIIKDLQRQGIPDHLIPGAFNAIRQKRNQDSRNQENIKLMAKRLKKS